MEKTWPSDASGCATILCISCHKNIHKYACWYLWCNLRLRAIRTCCGVHFAERLLISNLVVTKNCFAGFGFRQTFQPFFQPIQNFNNNVFQPFMQGVMHMIMGHDGHEHSSAHKFTDDGTESPQATGHDEIYPRDCGRDPEKGTGKLCFPDGLLCQNSKYFKHSTYIV